MVVDGGGGFDIVVKGIRIFREKVTGKLSSPLSAAADSLRLLLPSVRFICLSWQ
ncbi:hypothetical protein B296_00036920 [Ensete ventricosum]|uniref:Uncharacterized protein n=1 Tax=Ensete ventricosum TaxID=4639 RepID=A0A426YD21_ENSVE|nr:hypothetical protein B296_00036920 [Ensete ventricosum]